MTASLLNQLEADLDQLSLADQLWLMERLAHRIRVRTLRRVDVDEDALTLMAHDPAIQRELKSIEAEFVSTESDGLDMATS